MIEAVSSKNFDELLPLMRAYMAFYHVQNIDDANNKAFSANLVKTVKEVAYSFIAKMVKPLHLLRFISRLSPALPQKLPCSMIYTPYLIFAGKA